MTRGTELRVLASITEVDARQWDEIAGDEIFLRHAFLGALEATGCACARSGWTPQHLTLWRADRLVAALPLYAKTHSFGEFVFDWSWAEAYERSGRPYYPKLVSAVPFTPVAGTRLLAADAEAAGTLLRAALGHARRSGCSSWHVLFPTPGQAEALAQAGLLLREGVQFHWRNRGFRDFPDFLDSLTRDKRKKIRQERRKLDEAGIEVRRLSGTEVRAADWAFFVRCYEETYRLHGSFPYLNLAFFEQLGACLPHHLLLLIATREGVPIASALDVRGCGTLYGRYWGALEYVPGLHFDLCYYRGIEYCIEQGLECFEGGAQGEHKIARGFSPVRTWSAHWLADPAFGASVGRERSGIAAYVDELNERQPFKNGPRAPDSAPP
jgi:hypothetical protein